MKSAPVCILPVRGLGDGKSRLRGVIDGTTRADLNAFLLETTLDVLEDYPGAASVIVVSASDEVHARARRRGMDGVGDPGGGLNEAVAVGVAAARGRGASGVFIIPVDLPLLDASVLRRLVVTAPAGQVCVLAPDRAEQGTNFLYQSPVRIERFAYGVGSFERHRALAAAAGLIVQVRREPTLAFDLDLPADLEAWRRMRGAPAAKGDPCQ